jgi:outer membrane immunogenic protein
MLGKVMKVGLKGMLATSAAAAALFAGAQLAQADGMPAGPGYAVGPGLWNGGYVGFESGWEWDSTRVDFLSAPGEKSHWDRDVVNVGFFGGYQHQFGPLVIGVELNLIGNEFEQTKRMFPTSPTSGNCPNTLLNCIGRINNEFTVGPRVGWALGKFMPYATGGYATGEVQFKSIASTGVATTEADARQNGFYVGGGLDWKVSRNAVVGIEYRHTDLGSANTNFFFTSAPVGNGPEPIRQHAESDAIFLRGSLLFGGRDYEPLK